MTEKIQVKVTENALFDFMLYHTYSKFSGFLTNILGVAVGIMGIIMFCVKKASVNSLIFYLLAAVVFIGYTPILIKYRAHKQIKLMDVYRYPAEYTFDEVKGITVLQDGKEKGFDWGQLCNMVVTPKTIGIYYGEDQALIIPKEDFGEQFMPIMNIIMIHLNK